MATTTQSAAVNVATAEATEAAAPYVPQRFKLTFDDTVIYFVSEQRIQKIREGKVIKNIPYDHYGPELKTNRERADFLVLVCDEHDKQIEGSGTNRLEKLIDQVTEAANENIIDPETGEASSQRYGEHLMKPPAKSVGINALQDEIIATNAKVGEAWMIEHEPDADKQAALLSALGFKELGQLAGYMDTLAHKIETLVRRQAELLAKRQQKEAAKAEKMRLAVEKAAAEKAAATVGKAA